MAVDNHLRTYAKNGIQQKVRLDNAHEAYKAQEYKTKERIIDQLALRSRPNQTDEDRKYIDERLEKDEAVLVEVQDHVQDTASQIENLTHELSAHMKELSAIEIATGGFVTHPIGANKNTSLDEETMTVTMRNDGHIEIPIGVRLNHWRDSSQLTIRRKRGN